MFYTKLSSWKLPDPKPLPVILTSLERNCSVLVGAQFITIDNIPFLNIFWQIISKKGAERTTLCATFFVLSKENRFCIDSGKPPKPVDFAYGSIHRSELRRVCLLHKKYFGYQFCQIGCCKETATLRVWSIDVTVEPYQEPFSGHPVWYTFWRRSCSDQIDSRLAVVCLQRHWEFSRSCTGTVDQSVARCPTGKCWVPRQDR